MTDDLLRALGRAQRAELDADPAALAPDDLGRPFEGSEREALLDDLFARLDAEADRAPEQEQEPALAEPDPRAQPGPSSDSSPGSDKVVSLASRRRATWVGTAVVAAAAAAMLWWLVPGREQPELLASVPEYAFSRLDGGQASTRSEPGEPVAELELRPSGSIDWVLTPAEPTTTPIAVALLAEASDGRREFVGRLDAKITESGSVRIAGPLDRWVALSPGAWTLTLIIAPPEQLPDSADAAAEPGAWRALAVRVTIINPE